MHIEAFPNIFGRCSSCIERSFWCDWHGRCSRRVGQEYMRYWHWIYGFYSVIVHECFWLCLHFAFNTFRCSYNFRSTRSFLRWMTQFASSMSKSINAGSLCVVFFCIDIRFVLICEIRTHNSLRCWLWKLKRWRMPFIFIDMSTSISNLKQIVSRLRNEMELLKCKPIFVGFFLKWFDYFFGITF